MVFSPTIITANQWHSQVFALGKEAGHGNPASVKISTATCSSYSFLKLTVNLIHKERIIYDLDSLHFHTRDQCFLTPTVSGTFPFRRFNTFFPHLSYSAFLSKIKSQSSPILEKLHTILFSSLMIHCCI